jgi:hypothetical protein
VTSFLNLQSKVTCSQDFPAALIEATSHNLQLFEPQPASNHDFTTTSTSTTAIMGRVRTKTVKKSAKVIIERYYPKLTLDFETNKRICDEIAIIASKRLRNKVRILKCSIRRLRLIKSRLLVTPLI